MIRIRPVEPHGTRRVFAHVNHRDPARHGFQWIDVPNYPESPDGSRLRALRVALGMGLREAAARLGVSPAELSGLERGSMVADDWEAARAALRGAP